MPGYEANVPPTDPANYISLLRRFERAEWILPLPPNATDAELLDHRRRYTFVGRWRMRQIIAALGAGSHEFNEDEFYRVTEGLLPPVLAVGEVSVLVALARCGG
jgi:hypothetical protein